MALFLLPALARADQFNDGEAAFHQGDYQAAFKLWQPLADQGNAEARFQVGSMYESGLGVKQDKTKGTKLICQAAEEGNVKAQFILGGFYANGRNVTRDFVASTKWYRKAAEQGDRKSQDILGTRYQTGQGVKQNWAEAFKWWRKAAEQGDPLAQFQIGAMYQFGQFVVKQDWAEAYFWKSLALAALPNDVILLGEVKGTAMHLTPEQKAAVDKRVAEWNKAHPAPTAAPSKP